ncbi:hypothetical protein GGD56_007280, partial [Rhizobium mongolense]|nr:hypothetical protein [Rhizobium mongolense]
STSIKSHDGLIDLSHLGIYLPEAHIVLPFEQVVPSNH